MDVNAADDMKENEIKKLLEQPVSTQTNNSIQKFTTALEKKVEVSRCAKAAFMQFQSSRVCNHCNELADNG